MIGNISIEANKLSIHPTRDLFSVECLILKQLARGSVIDCTRQPIAIEAFGMRVLLHTIADNDIGEAGCTL
ncbi:unnamed protein product [Brugia timori]|uniref:Transcriptional regulator n=1 Tax=Brugia timori TaxID=42155 RepID=A0A0R3QSX5_9BILA|nr:unnamed protein product [Brugia timori]